MVLNSNLQSNYTSLWLDNLKEALKHTLSGLVTNGSLNYCELKLLFSKDAANVLDTLKRAPPSQSFIKFLLHNICVRDYFCTPPTNYFRQSCNLSLFSIALFVLVYSKVCSHTRTQEICSLLARGNPSKS